MLKGGGKVEPPDTEKITSAKAEKNNSIGFIGPSEVRGTRGANLGRQLFLVLNLFWSERSACDQRSKLR